MALKYLRGFGYVVLVAVIGVGGFWYIQEIKPCTKPITYRIGILDPQFGVSHEEFLSSIVEAEQIWESAIGLDLFSYTPEGRVSVNLIFDERQRETLEQKQIQEEVDLLQALYESKKLLLEQRSLVYQNASDAYEEALADFQEKSSSFETTVNYWNARGGAPEREYREIILRQRELQDLQKELEVERSLVNRLADEVNVLVDEVNILASKTNKAVEEYNQGDLIGMQFDQGMYTREGRRISVDIYQFTDKTKLVRVLAHELGHVLGLDHNENPESIMYEINRADGERLSFEDVNSLKERCRIETN